VEKLEKGPIEERGCTDILCCLLYIAACVAFVIIWGMAMSNGEPDRLFAVYDSSNKSCGIDVADKPYVYFPIPNTDSLNVRTCVSACPTYLNDADRPASLDCNTLDNVYVD